MATAGSGRRARNIVSVGLAKGSFTAIMGPSGSGKSTLLHVAAVLDRPTSGTVMSGNTDLSRLSERRSTILRREQIGTVFQAFNLLPSLRSLRTSRCRCAWTVGVRGGRTCGKLRHASVSETARPPSIPAVRWSATAGRVTGADDASRGGVRRRADWSARHAQGVVCSRFYARSWTNGHTVVIVTHDPSPPPRRPRPIARRWTARRKAGCPDRDKVAKQLAQLGGSNGPTSCATEHSSAARASGPSCAVHIRRTGDGRRHDARGSTDEPSARRALPAAAAVVTGQQFVATKKNTWTLGQRARVNAATAAGWLLCPASARRSVTTPSRYGGRPSQVAHGGRAPRSRPTF